jgi:DNA-directed RNA polymerase subunit RPC12/RpoP
MQLEFQCQKCEESFSLEFSDLGTDPELRCPGCGAHAPEEQVENLLAALEEVFAAMSPLRRKFSSTVELDSEDLPPPYDEAPSVTRKAALLDEEETEDEDEENEGAEEREADEL